VLLTDARLVDEREEVESGSGIHYLASLLLARECVRPPLFVHLDFVIDRVAANMDAEVITMITRVEPLWGPVISVRMHDLRDTFDKARRNGADPNAGKR